MGLSWPIPFRSLEHGSDLGLLFLDDALGNNRPERPVIAMSAALGNNRPERPVIAMSARWEPERDPKAVVRALRCTSFERICSERSE
jgi:hypothetical protein